MTTDTQRARCYRAEDAVMGDLDGGILDPVHAGGWRAGMLDAEYSALRARRLAEIRRVGRLVTDTAWWQELTGLDLPQHHDRHAIYRTNITLARRGARGSTGGQYKGGLWGISINTWHARPWHVAHELSHVGQYRAIWQGHYMPRLQAKAPAAGLAVAGHGPEFTGVYLAVVSVLLGGTAAGLLADSFDEHRVRVTPCPVPPPYTGPGLLNTAGHPVTLARAARPATIDPITDSAQLSLFT